MTTIAGTVTGVQLLQGSNAGPEQSGQTTVRKTYLVTANFGTYTGSTDAAQITGVGDRIKEVTKQGRSVTVRAAIGGPPGRTAAGAAVYASATITNTSGTLDFDLGGVTAEADSAASTGVGIVVLVDEGVVS